jgi:hypothetical protein
MAIKSFIDTGAIWDGDTYSVKYFGVSKMEYLKTLQN